MAEGNSTFFEETGSAVSPVEESQPQMLLPPRAWVIAAKTLCQLAMWEWVYRHRRAHILTWFFSWTEQKELSRSLMMDT